MPKDLVELIMLAICAQGIANDLEKNAAECPFTHAIGSWLPAGRRNRLRFGEPLERLRRAAAVNNTTNLGLWQLRGFGEGLNDLLGD